MYVSTKFHCFSTAVIEGEVVILSSTSMSFVVWHSFKINNVQILNVLVSAWRHMASRTSPYFSLTIPVLYHLWVLLLWKTEQKTPRSITISFIYLLEAINVQCILMFGSFWFHCQQIYETSYAFVLTFSFFREKMKMNEHLEIGLFYVLLKTQVFFFLRFFSLYYNSYGSLAPLGGRFSALQTTFGYDYTSWQPLGIESDKSCFNSYFSTSFGSCGGTVVSTRNLPGLGLYIVTALDLQKYVIKRHYSVPLHCWDSIRRREKG